MAILIEIAANSFRSCLSAQEGGADRIELFENLGEGGCTPSYGVLKQVYKNITIPVYVMIRPRGGDFVYSNDEFEIMKHDIGMCKQLGFPGVVFGILDSEGNVNRERNEILLELAKPMKATFHRAFDRTRDLNNSIMQLIDLGFDRVLTSGGEPDVVQGKEIIKNLQEQYGKDIIIMPGCGVTAGNAKEIVSYCGVQEIHATAKELVCSQAKNQKKYFADTRYESSPEIIKAIKKSL